MLMLLLMFNAMLNDHSCSISNNKNMWLLTMYWNCRPPDAI